MAKNEIKPLIREILKEKEEPITLEKLTEKIRNKRGTVRNTSIIENLLKLLEKKEIRVSGIDIERHQEIAQKKGKTREQKIYLETLTFELVQKDFTDILNLLKELLENNNKTARTKLEIIFEEKIKSMEEKWERYEEKLEFRDLSKEVVTWLKANDSLLSYNLHSKDWLSYPESLRYIKNRYKELLNKFDDESYDEYSFRQIRKFKDEEIPEMPLANKKGIEEFYLMNLIYSRDIGQNSAREEELKHYGLAGQEISVISGSFADFVEPLDDDEFLEKRLGYPKPTKRSKKEVKRLFSSIMRYLFLNKNLPDKKIEEISWALSNEEGSNELLNQIIQKIIDNKEKSI